VRVPPETYYVIYSALREPGDIPSMSVRWGIPEEVLRAIYIHRVIRRTIARHPYVLSHMEDILSAWNDGEDIVAIAREYDYPPVLVAVMLLQAMGYTRKKAWSLLSDPAEVEDARLREELRMASEVDIVYSPSASEEQHQRGAEMEDEIARLLSSVGVAYLREGDLRGGGRKTPDFLLKDGVRVREHVLKWVEAKASFCDEEEMSRVSRRQLIPYVNTYGPGVVVYRYGYVDGLKPPEKVMLMDMEEFITLVERL